VSPIAIASLSALGIALIIVAVQASEPEVADGEVIVPPEPEPPEPEPKPDPYGIPDSASVLLLGDSLGVGIAPHLAPLVRSGRFEARVKVGRTTKGAVSALQGDEKTYDAVLVSLGSNDALIDPSTFADSIAKLVEGVRSDTNQLFWVVPPGFTYGTSKSPSGVEAFTAAMLAAGFDSQHLSSPVPPAPDDPMHLHLAPSGYKAFAKSIADGLYL
jgi:lysophospholipase L1-like esterase